MTLQIWFWIIMALWLFFGVYRERANPNFTLWVSGLLVEFVLFLIIGWQVFGSPVK